MNINITTDEDTHHEAIETKRHTVQLTLMDVLNVSINENDEPINLPQFFVLFNDNQKLCQAEPIPTSKIVDMVNRINALVQAHKEFSFKYQRETQERQNQVKAILAELQLHNSQAKPQYANVVNNFSFKNGDGDGRISLEICEPIKQPIVNYGITQDDSEVE